MLSDKELNILRGKAIAGKISEDELLSVFAHIDEMYEILDEADESDTLGTEGWRHYFGLDD